MYSLKVFLKNDFLFISNLTHVFFHLEDPTVAAQTDSVHRVVGVGDCKHLEEGGGDEG